MDKTPIKLKLDGIDAPQKRVRIKNAPVSEVFSLCELVQYQEGQVVSRTLAQNENMSLTLFSFDKGEEIGTHSAGGDAFLTCIDGGCRIIVDETAYELAVGQSIVMPTGHPHSVHASERFKMLLAVIK